MSNSDEYTRSELEKIKGLLSSLDMRVEKIESNLNIQPGSRPQIIFADQSASHSDNINDHGDNDQSFLESRIGEYGLAWMGNIVLLFGITFFIGYLKSQGMGIMSVLLGYLCVAIILILSNWIHKSFPHMGFALRLNGQILIYYVTLRLHYFTGNPVLSNEIIAFTLLVIVNIVQVIYAGRAKSQTVFIIAITLGVLTAIVSDSTHIMLLYLALICATSTYFTFRFNWGKSLIISIVLVYSGILIWFLNNPIMGNSYGAISDHSGGIFYLFIIAAVYSLIALAREKDNISEEFAMSVIIINGLSFSVLLTVSVIEFFTDNYIGLFIAITLYCLAYAVILKTYSKWKFTSASYALYGFVAMSIALYGLFGLPRVFFLLAIQSLVVISFALWFRNKIIVIMNALLLISLLTVYLAVSDPVNDVNFSFALVTLLTARILNWKKERLVIQTDILRNIFLMIGFVLVLYSFYHWAPKEFITLYWTAAALAYFLLSIILKNKKYRIMSLGTISVATVYLLVVDLAKIAVLIRVSALLFLAFISIGISIYYSKSKKNI